METITRPLSPYSWAVALAAVLAARANAGDWPTYRGDSQRSGHSAETLPAELSPQWTYRFRHAPCPAWSGRDTRMPFDRAFHAVVAGDSVFFGSSADCKVYALDAATGAERWTFFTGAPVRFPPTVWNNRLFAVSDDGFLYCLAADDGRLLWKRRGGPDEDMVLGNGRLVSRWPARGAPVVADGVVYFAAGIWPSEGIFVYAMDAACGSVFWCNDQSGGLDMAQPHPGARAASGISAQGHLAVAGDVLLVPTGRAVPAALARDDGRLLHFRLQENGKYGGSEIMASADVLFCGGAAFDIATGARIPSIPALRPELAAATPDGVTCWHDRRVRSLRWTRIEGKDRRGATISGKGLEEAWSTPVPYGGSSLVVAGSTAVSAGRGSQGDYGVATVDLGSQVALWSHRVEGEPCGLAVAGERLLVSTDQGVIHCFGQERGETHFSSATAKPAQMKDAPVAFPAPAPGVNRSEPGDKSRGRGRTAFDPSHPSERYVVPGHVEQAAQEILQQSGVTEGYCVDLGCGDGALAQALAERSRLVVYAIDPDPENVAAARQKLDAAGLYGVRVTVHEGDPAKTPYPPYMANLVVSGRSFTGGWPEKEGLPEDVGKEAGRLLRPYGGVALIGNRADKPGAMEKIVRGPLEGAGWWTHQYCDPANSNCSADALLASPLGVLWFGDLGLTMPSRHGRGRSPLALDGRLFIQGRDAVLAVDAYNGRKLWEHPLAGVQAAYDGEHLMGTSGTGSNFCIGQHGLYVHTGSKCLRLDPATGELLAEFSPPEQPDGKPGTWGVIACQGDTLLGTLANTEHVVTYRFHAGDMQTQFTESLLLFAADAWTGQVRWRHQPQHSIRHNAIAVGGGRVYLIDRPMALGDRHLEKRRGVPDPGDEHPTGALVALDAADGSVLWRSEDDIFGTLLALSEEYDTLLMCYQDWRFKLASELGGRMAAFDATTGQRRWDLKAACFGRPILNGHTVYIEPGAWDLLTGEAKDFTLSRSYGCGIPAASRKLMVFRSATLGYLDLAEGSGGKRTENYGGIRPGCWINALPAGGLVLMPDATDRCTCSYLIKASIALAPREAL